jgi:hypothetical protein
MVNDKDVQSSIPVTKRALPGHAGSFLIAPHVEAGYYSAGILSGVATLSPLRTRARVNKRLLLQLSTYFFSHF